MNEQQKGALAYLLTRSIEWYDDNEFVKVMEAKKALYDFLKIEEDDYYLRRDILDDMAKNFKIEK